MKYHINKKGVPAVCHAKVGKCPLGGASGLENHFNTIEAAQNYADELNQSNFINNKDEIQLNTAQEKMNVLKKKLQNKNLTVSQSDEIRTSISEQHELYNQANHKIEEISNVLKTVNTPDGGATFTLDGVVPITGFCASPYPEYSKVFNSAKDVSFNSLASYFADVKSKNEKLMNEDETYIGVWNDPDTGKVYVDVSKRYKTAQEARKECQKHDQIAFFDLNMLESVEVDKNAKSGQ